MSINIVENGVLKNVSGGGSAIRDGDGNIITDTYARKDHVVNSSVVTETGFMADARLLNPNNEDSPLKNLELNVKNIPITEIVFPSLPSDAPYIRGYGRCYYQVRNGICFLSLAIRTKTNLPTNSNYPSVIENVVPPCESNNVLYFFMNVTYPGPKIGSTPVVLAINNKGNIYLNGGEENIDWYEICCSYPVKAN